MPKRLSGGGINLRPEQKPQDDYQTWDEEYRKKHCIICGQYTPTYALIYKGYCFCQNDLPVGFERWDGKFKEDKNEAYTQRAGCPDRTDNVDL